jgi:hypothetical protein
MCGSIYFFGFVFMVIQQCHPPTHPIGADAPLGGGLILLQQMHPRGGDVW